MSGGRQRTRAALAQNLFSSQAPARRLARLSGVGPGERVYDFGAGTGRLTTELVKAGACVIAVEKDPTLAAKLATRFAGRHVTVLRADLADVRFQAPFKVAANLPFNATAAALRRLLFETPRPDAAALVLQREAARKWAGAGRATLVSLSARPWFEMEVVEAFARSDFTPVPAVETALLRVRRKPHPDLADADAESWRAFLGYALARPAPDARRVLRGLLSNLQWRRLSGSLGIAPNALRADLAYEQWLGLFRFVRVHAPRHKLRRLGGAG
ncbi:MAG: ribosomal RNA small subunit methyltransferase A [Caulobacteraceae bacterium]